MTKDVLVLYGEHEAPREITGLYECIRGTVELVLDLDEVRVYLICFMKI